MLEIHVCIYEEEWHLLPDPPQMYQQRAPFYLSPCLDISQRAPSILLLTNFQDVQIDEPSAHTENVDCDYLVYSRFPPV